MSDAKRQKWADEEWVRELQEAVDEIGQSEVAKKMGCSSALIHQLRNGTYPSPVDRYRRRFKSIFAEGAVECPILGEIGREECAHHRNRPFAATNPIRIELYRTCPTCPNNPDA